MKIEAPAHKLSDLVVSEDLQVCIGHLLEDLEFSDALADHGLQVRNKILLHGPPGCGKTSIAHGLAEFLGIKISVVAGSSINESYRGKSEQNVAQIFDFAKSNRVVLLFDEFDSVAATRFWGAEDSASKTDNRVVNEILTGLDRANPLGLIVACTNSLSEIDPAIQRRFHLIAEVAAPGRQVLLQIAENVIQGRFGIEASEILKVASTPSDVVRAAKDRLRYEVIVRAKAAKRKPRELVAELDQKLELITKNKKRNSQVEFAGL